MLKLFKDCFYLTNKYLILIFPLIFTVIALILYLNSISELDYDKFFICFSNVTIWIFLSGSFAGWFYMIKKALSFNNRIFIYEKDRKEAYKDLFKSYFNGIGRLFLPMLVVVGLLMCYVLVFNIILSYIIPFLNDNFSYKSLLAIVFAVSVFLFYWLFLWIPEIVFVQRNPFIAFLNSIKSAYLSFYDNIKLYSVVVLMFMFVNIFYNICEFNPILLFFVLFFCYYLVLYIVILVFVFYEQQFIK